MFTFEVIDQHTGEVLGYIQADTIDHAFIEAQAQYPETMVGVMRGVEKQ